jgi:hypothetical protein
MQSVEWIVLYSPWGPPNFRTAALSNCLTGS